MIQNQTIPTLNEALAPGAESLLQAAFQCNLLDKAAIGILRDGRSYQRLASRRIESPVPENSLFEIGSVTKLYTAELLLILAQRGIVNPRDPIAKYLQRDPGSGPITLLDLATHCSGLPRLPPNLRRLHSPNPYAKYSAVDLNAYLRKSSLQVPAQPQFLYSNLGYTLLGHVLSRAAGLSYSELLHREILVPLKLDNTMLALTGRPIPNLLQGYTQAGRPAQHWTFDACAPAGGLCSTAGDQLQWLAALLQKPDMGTLQPYAQAGAGKVGLGWMIRPDGYSCWHNGGTCGFSSYVATHRQLRYAVVVLANRYAPSLVLALGSSFELYLQGKPAPPLEGDYGKARAQLLEPVISAARPLASLINRARIALRY